MNIKESIPVSESNQPRGTDAGARFNGFVESLFTRSGTSGGRFSGEAVARLISECRSSHCDKKDLFNLPDVSSPEAFSLFGAGVQRSIIELGLQTYQHKKVASLLPLARYDVSEQLQEHLSLAIKGRRFGSALTFINQFNLSFGSDAQEVLRDCVPPMYQRGLWNSRESLVQLLLRAEPQSWQWLSDERKDEIVALACSVEKIEAAHLLGTQMGLTDNQMRAALIPEFLDAGRPELARSIAEHFGQPLQAAELSAALDRAERRLETQPNQTSLHTQEILTEFSRSGTMPLAKITELTGKPGQEEMAVLVLLQFRGQVFAHISSGEGGHPGAVERFRELLAHEGFAGPVTVLGGTILHSESENSLVVLGASSTYGACDREQAAEIIRKAYPEISVRVRHDFSEIKGSRN